MYCSMTRLLESANTTGDYIVDGEAAWCWSAVEDPIVLAALLCALIVGAPDEAACRGPVRAR
jgi:hypothetical protein